MLNISMTLNSHVHQNLLLITDGLNSITQIFSLSWTINNVVIYISWYDTIKAFEWIGVQEIIEQVSCFFFLWFVAPIWAELTLRQD